MIPLYDKRYMMGVMATFRRPTRFLQSMFFDKNTIVSDKETVDIDIIKQSTRAAPAYVRKYDGPNLVVSEGYVTEGFSPPHIKEYTETNAHDFLKRQPGETIYEDNKPPIARARKKLAEDMAKLNDRFDVAEEVQAAQILFNGKVRFLDKKGKDTITELDYGREASHDVVMTGLDTWDNVSSADPFEQIEEMSNDLVLEDSEQVVDRCIMGREAYKWFIRNLKIREQLDILKYDIGRLDRALLRPGANYVANLGGIDFYTYNMKYTDPVSGAKASLIPEKEILLASSQAKTSRLYGAISEKIDQPTHAVRRYPYQYPTQDGSKVMLEMFTRPLLVFHDIDSTARAQVLA